MTNAHYPDKSAVLLRPAYPYGKTQTWLPMDLYKVAAKLDAVGVQTDIVDLNFEKVPDDLARYDFVGIGVIGPPYVPITIDLANRVYKEFRRVPLIGGQGVEYLSPDQFEKLYPHACQIRNDVDLEAAIGRKVPSIYSTSIAQRIQNLDDIRAGRYLSSEFSFFVSQGCKHACGFCQADRSRRGQKAVEKFNQVMEADLSSLMTRARKVGIGTLSMYLSSLDLFQNPSSIAETLELFSYVSAQSGTKVNLRGLSRVDSFLDALKSEEKLSKFFSTSLFAPSRLRTIGFGVDGTAENVWRSQHKGKISLSEVDRAFSICWQYGITAEALLVMGFYDEKGKPVETAENLQDNLSYAVHAAEELAVVARPHVAKNFGPGNDGWNNPIWDTQRQHLLDNPQLFRNLDFVALASCLTHPDADFRGAVNNTYLEIVKRLTPIRRCVTTPLLPLVESLDELMVDPRLLVDTFNLLVPFDR